MSHSIKKLIYSLLAAVITAAAAGLFCIICQKPEENGRAVINFTEIAESESVVNTEISRSVSAFRKGVTRKGLLELAGAKSGITAPELKEMLSVERLGDSSGAEIILRGMENPSEAPIILINILILAEKDEEIPAFEVISPFELPKKPQLPIIPLSASIGIIAGLICYAAMPSYRREHRVRRVDTENDYRTALSMQEYIEDACRSAANLGELPLTAPEGLEKSGYTAAAEALMSVMGKDSPKIIAVSPDFRTKSGETSPHIKIASYLACALAEKGSRTVIVDCMLKNPSVSGYFKLNPRGGLSEMLYGKCAVWDIVSVNARKGVDVIGGRESCPNPREAFSQPSWEQLMSYIAPQYDVIILCVSKAFDCAEWKLVTDRCDGILVVCGENGISAETAKGVLGLDKTAALCAAG